MPTLSQLQSAYDQAKKNLDASILVFNQNVQNYLGGYRDVSLKLYCVAPNGGSKPIVGGYDWANIAFTINSYSDIDKIKRNANLSTNSNTLCPAPNSLFGTGDVSGASAGPAFNNLLTYSLIPFKNAYDDLMAKYSAYNAANTALTTNPEYQGTILAAGVTAKNKWIFAIVVVVVAGILVFVYFKWFKK